MLSISERLFHELRRTPEWPRPIQLSARCVRFRVSDIAAYIANRPAAGTRAEPEQLRAKRRGTI
ncbi:MAG: hypothetical protein K2X67_13060 [Burkholderiales bacterium]|nr:hypothetical protein [Burkholderiales bacterium]